ncbi:LysR family transcriptional regulator [Marinomonas balearica]|uniref:LysR family glycine cleavage system transcriptional activator n=1 Tax=Marinomonas balearica TaxID=491947 RepID=A0A4V3CFZ1_9GAMM|nr:LysR family transcriptional regulator [Marinomonas balearica]TDO95742.1 LysR family glycine cleavage system transcriptional activator [Marinomonas balearica]
MSIPYSALYTFQLAVRLGSLKSTADHLSLTESAVSHQLKRLEKQLDQALWIKQGRQLVPTEAGIKLADRLESPFKDIASALTELESGQESLTLYVQPSLLDIWLLPKVLPFRSNNPSIRLSIKYLASAPERLNATDILIKGYDRNYQTQNYLFPVLKGETIAVCSPLFRDTNNIKSPESLLHSTLLHDNSISAWQDWFSKLGLHLPSQPDLIYEDFHLLKSAALAAQGIALCPICLIDEELNNGKLIQLFSNRGNQGRMYGLEFAQTANSNLKRLAYYLRDFSALNKN